MPPSDTFFTLRPHWDWLIVFYFFLGGISAGSYVFSAILDIFGRPTDRPLARLGYKIAMATVVLCPVLLIVDLTRPERFWHMMLQNNTMAPIIKTYSPISIGAWALLVFGAFVTVSWLGALAEEKQGLRGFGFLGRGTLGKVIAAIGTLPGFFIAGYTGVLLNVTNRPVWADTPMLGALFLLSGAAAAAALMGWLGERRASPASVAWITKIAFWVALVELVTLVITALTLGSVGMRVWSGLPGIVLVVGVLILGLLVPLWAHAKPTAFGPKTIAIGAALAVLGSFLLRVVFIFSGEVAS
jgi:formate-dependent nitrite reductase membrane component NrfD